MESSPQRNIPLLGVISLVSFICLINGNSNQLIARKIDGLGLNVTNSDSDFIGIDCGVSGDYIDKATGIWYQTDKKLHRNRNQSCNVFWYPHQSFLRTTEDSKKLSRRKSKFVILWNPNKARTAPTTSMLSFNMQIMTSKINLQVLICTLEPTTGKQLVLLMQPKWSVVLWFIIPQQTSYKFVL